MRQIAFAASLLLASLTTAASSAAQIIHGTVVEQDTERVVSGAFIVLLDAEGAQADAALTDLQGGFALQPPGPGDYRLGLDRIGYLSVTTPLFTIEPGQTIEYRLAARVEPVELSAIDVKVESSCRVRPEVGTAAAIIWEEARKALVATAWSQRQGLVKYTIVDHQRTLDPYSLEVRDETTQKREGISRGSPYVARESDLLDREGYSRLEGDVQLYYAPDAATLTSASFLDQHCFHVVPAEEGRDGLVGLAFEPVAERSTADIAGTIWIAEETAHLQTIEFDYTGLPSVLDGEATGRIEFDRLPTGQWIVERWLIRMPVIRAADEDLYSHLTMDPAERSAAILALEEDSGEVIRAVAVTRDQISPPDGPPARMARQRPADAIDVAGIEEQAIGGAVVSGMVHDSATGVALPGARVAFTWEVASPGLAVARTNGAGRYVVRDIPAGVRVTAVALFPRRRGEVVLMLAEGARTAALDLQAAGSLPVDGAGLESEIVVAPGPAEWESSTIAGVVRDAVSGEPLPGAQIEIEDLDRGAVASTDGSFRLEDVPAGSYSLKVEFLGYATGSITVAPGTGPLSVTARLLPSPIVMAALDIVVPVEREREVDRTLGQSRYVLTADDLPENTTLPIGKVLAQRMPGLRFSVMGGCGVLTTREGPVGMVVLDGQRIPDTCVLGMVEPADIERVELLPGTAAMIEYGMAASGGVLIITTRHGG